MTVPTASAALPVAVALQAPLDVIVVRKLGLPSQPELAMGAIGEDGVRVLDRDLVRLAGVRPDELRDVERREQSLLRSRVDELRRGRPRTDLNGRVAVIVDDGPESIRAAITSTSLTIPITAGKLALGTWQAIYVWEHRTSPHTRRLVVTLLGATGNP